MSTPVPPPLSPIPDAPAPIAGSEMSAPEAQTLTSSPPQSSRSLKLGLMGILVVGIVLCLTAVVWYFTQSTSPISLILPTSTPVSFPSATSPSTPVPTPSIASTSSPVPQPLETLIMQGSLQYFLSQNCALKDPSLSGYYVLKGGVVSLPIRLDTTQLEIAPSVSGETATCATTKSDAISQAYVVIGSQPTYYLFDNESSELGHGGPPFIGLFGTEIYQQSPYTIFAYLNGPHGGPAFIEDMSIQIRVVKRFNTRAGSPAYFSTNRELVLAGVLSKTAGIQPFIDTYQKETFSYNGKTIEVAISSADIWLVDDGSAFNDEGLKAELARRYGQRPIAYSSEIDFVVGKSRLKDGATVEQLIKVIYPTTEALLTDPVVKKVLNQLESVKAKE